MLKSKLSALLSLLLVFLSGVLVGAVGHRLYMVNTVSSTSPIRPAARPDPEEIRKHIVAEIRQRVKLGPEQVEQLNQIYDKTRQEFDRLHQRANADTRTIWDQQNEAIKAILRPEQRLLFEQYRAERDAERKRRHAEKK